MVDGPSESTACDDSALMKTSSALFTAIASVAILTALPPASLRAQTETTTTTTTVLPGAQTQVQTQVETVQPTPVAVVPQPGQHIAEIEVSVARGTVQAYFGKAPRGEKAEIGGLQLNIKLPSTATVTKIASRDNDSPGATKVTADNPWHVTVPFFGAGRYVFNISDMDNDPVVTSVVVKVDGVVLFSGHGRDDDFENWPQKTYGAGVRKTGSREIAFILGPE